MDLQSPGVFTALRRAVDLSGPPVQMSMSEEVVPVIIVEDVRNFLETPFDYVIGGKLVSAVALQFSSVGLVQGTFDEGNKRRMFCDRVDLVCEVSTYVLCEIGGIIGGVPDAPAGPRNFLDRLGNMQGSVRGTTNAAAPSVAFSDGIFYMPAGRTLTLQPQDPWVLNSPGQASLVFTMLSANITMAGTFWWREDKRP